MKILICAAIFDNTRRVASQRPRALAEHLARLGNDVTVATAAVNPDLKATSPAGIRTIMLPAYDDGYDRRGSELAPLTRILVALAVLPTSPAAFWFKSRWLSQLTGRTPKEREAALERLNKTRLSTASSIKALLASRSWADSSFEHLSTELESESTFDIVFSTFGPFASLWLGEKVKDTGMASKWICDFRDVPDQTGPLPWLRWTRRYFQNQAIKKADLTTTVSQGCRRELLKDTGKPKKYKSRIKVLPNGFVSRAVATSSQQQNKDAPLRITYVGQLYPGRSKPDMLFTAIRKILATSPKAKIEFHYAGPHGSLIRDIARERCVEQILVDHGHVSHEKAISLQNDSDALLVLAWNEDGNEGVLSAKFFEYMAAKKPLIALISGSKPDSELAELTTKLNLGIACEYIEGSEAEESLEIYVKGLASQKAKAGKTLHFPSVAGIARFNYQNIARELQTLMETLL